MAAAIETTLGALMGSKAGLERVLQTKFDKDGGAKVRYHAMKLARLVEQELKTFGDAQTALLKDLGYDPLSGPTIELKPEHRATYNQQMQDLSAHPVTLAWGPLTAAMLDPYLDLTPADLLALGPLYDLGTLEG